jgi:hypothetical protein
LSIFADFTESRQCSHERVPKAAELGQFFADFNTVCTGIRGNTFTWLTAAFENLFLPTDYNFKTPAGNPKTLSQKSKRKLLLP